tara:strand:+ start:119 stop:574 length:456 start_codon:yes stop_codon:yes gene_type:complete
MGRYKKYTTKQSQRDRKREKSSRYYYNHRNDILKKKREEIVETDFNEWCDPEKVTLSFVWFCFSKLSEEQIGDRLMDFKVEFRNMFRKSLVNKNKELLNTKDDDVKDLVQKNIEIEVDKNENRMIDDLLSQMNLTKDDWKKSLGLDEMGLS